MEIIAQSQSVKKAPYIHVGYLAATSLQPSGPFFYASIISVLLGLIVGARFVRRTPKAGWHFIFVKTPVGRIGWCLAALGLLLFLASYMLGEKVSLHPERRTQIVMSQIMRDYKFQVESGKMPLKLPARPGIYAIAELTSRTENSSPTYAEKQVDAWSNAYKIHVPYSTATIRDIFIISAGADKIYETQDDISYSLSND